MRRFRILTIVGAVVALAAFALVPGASALDIADGTPPNGTVGVPYSYTWKMSEGSGSYPMTWSIESGSLPPGLSLSTASDTRSATASGTPTKSGSFSFYVVVKDGGTGGPPSTEVKYTINISPGSAPKPKLTVTTTSLPDATVNQAYTAPPLAASGGTVSSWTLASGTLPPGVALGANGVISGTPTQGGLFTFVVQANSSSATADTHQLTLFVSAPLGLQTLVNRTPPARGLTAKKAVGVQLKTGVKAVGGRPPYAFTATGSLPPGLTLDSATGAISGAGTAAGRYPFTVTVTDGTGAKVSVEWNITILALLDFAKGKGLPAGRVGDGYSAQIPVRGKDAKNAQFAVAGEIPPGLEVGEDGRLTGTLLKAGVYRLKVFAFPESGGPVSKVFRFRVRG